MQKSHVPGIMTLTLKVGLQLVETARNRSRRDRAEAAASLCPPKACRWPAVDGRARGYCTDVQTQCLGGQKLHTITITITLTILTIITIIIIRIMMMTIITNATELATRRIRLGVSREARGLCGGVGGKTRGAHENRPYRQTPRNAPLDR